MGGVTFDNNSGATGATIAQLNNLGQGIFNPVDKGSSADIAFKTTAAGDFAASNPAGGTFNFNGNPVANFGWEIISTAPSAASVLISGRVSSDDNNRIGIANAIVTIAGSGGELYQTRTNSFGFYRFDNIEVGQTYVLNVSARRYNFEPRVITVYEELTNINFVPLN